MRRSRFLKNRLFKLVLITGLISLIMISVYNSARPVITVFAKTTAINHATKCVNEIADAYLKSLNVHYSDVAKVQTNSNGDVAAIRIDSLTLNQVKNGITAKIADSFSDIMTADMNIPIGTLSGSNLLAGKGAMVPLSVSYSASAESELSNLFITRGINQTLHRILLQIKIRVQMLSYGKTQTTEIKLQVTVAETVIVGMIPEIYAGADDELWPNLVE